MAVTPVPNTVERAWGADVARDFTIWLEGVLDESTVSEPQWRQTNQRLEHLEHGLDTVKADLEVVKADVAILKSDVADLKLDMREFRREVNERFDRIHERFDEMHRQIISQTRWTVGVLALFGSLIAMLVAIGQLAPLILSGR